MKKHLLKFSSILFLGLTLSTATVFTSCSNDDNVPYSIPTFSGNVESVTFDEVTIDPKLNNNGASYRWINNATQQVLSTQQVLKYTFNTPGTYNLVLSEQNGSSYRYYTYNVIVSKSYNYNYVTLDLSTFNLTDGLNAQGGKIWSKTYTDKVLLQHQIFTFSHTSEYPATWDGFTVSNVKDDKNYNQEGSAGFIENQWGSMAKGGLKGEGSPFIIGYWSYYMKDWQATAGTFNEKQYSNWIKIGNGKDSYKAVDINISNHPWPYYGNLTGDSFARKFEKGDYFKVMIYGVDKNNKINPKPVTHYLADFRGDKLIMSKDWNKVDLSSLGEVSYLVFQMETTDAGDYGPNTAVYFCMDGLTVDKIDKK
ncbi:DUF4465 domain-containing protein [Myroides marinus]|uniref:DUF4465 domain-containing protein n=1 Tax=Myroides marinus TaxID=703342 RepID=UPI0025757884|nr:DUF4465 domain-containing protein [Myroides marinus]MDM1348896.1 DUF4465 domain-containing protein [Myroides marinus]MDM1352542.1 DUF4465 domain-containing protein [Myroides marinus]MDM1356111.1 DUF4465 domain-containing protein [Myroides marinus]MDM1359747.1 DUF4465 domain-containing protein [Myroides marinus]MDM1363283.1 DUF4465 domain-containing protein [Myroides marinus]